MATRISHTTQTFQATAEGEEYIKIKISHTLPLTTDLKEPKGITLHPSDPGAAPPWPREVGGAAAAAQPPSGTVLNPVRQESKSNKIKCPTGLIQMRAPLGPVLVLAPLSMQPKWRTLQFLLSSQQYGLILA